nr:WG repeat-containing protein [Rhodohalobacter sp. 614A]
MYSYIDKEGNLIRDFDFESAEIFSSGFAVIKMPGNTNSGNQNYIDKSGNIVFDSHLKKTKHSLWVLILLKQKIKQ